MKSLRAIFPLVAAAALLLVPGWPAGAEEADPDDEGTPAYSVARLLVREGSVWVLSPDTGDWEEYEQNTPVGPRTRLSVPEGSEAELQFHGGQFMLVTGGTEVDIRNLSEERSSFRIRSGEIRFDLPEADFSPVRVAVPGKRRVDFEVPGKYWLLIEGGDARLVVRRGEAKVTLARRDYKVREGEEAVMGDDLRISPYGGGPEKEAPPPSLSDVEARAGLPPAAVYELREYGEWVETPEYGVVWRPRVAPGWTPYFYGRWAWISPFGWTWISYEPWGWYPYHFGWWYADPFFGWVWCPFRTFVSVNVVVGRPILYHRHVFFVPATVRFVRDGRRVRWVPLRPGERFSRPSFTRAETRLVTWHRPLDSGKVFVRQEKGGVRHWRDWTEVRGERRNAGVPRLEERAKRGVEEREAAPKQPGAHEGVGVPGKKTRGVPAVGWPGKEGRSERVEPQRPGSREKLERRGPRGRPGREGRPANGSLREKNQDSGAAGGVPALPPSRVGPRTDRVREAGRPEGRSGRPGEVLPDWQRDYGGGTSPLRPPLTLQRLDRPPERVPYPPASGSAGGGAIRSVSPDGRLTPGVERPGPKAPAESDASRTRLGGGKEAARKGADGDRAATKEGGAPARNVREFERGGRWGPGGEGGFEGRGR